MQSAVTFAVCGLGSRGYRAYASFQNLHPEKMKIVAIAELDEVKLELAKKEFGVADEMCFSSIEELLKQPKLASAMIIATQDRQHADHALPAMEKGYDILLEKPISPFLDECLSLQKKATALGRTVVICHVLRYTKFYQKVNELVKNGSLGKICTIDATENIGYWHFAHSFVRGNWRNAQETSPMILAKCCHDMDILRWLAGEPCVSLSSFGELEFFNESNAPKGSGMRCIVDCGCKDSCIYNAEEIYLNSPRTGVRHGKTSWPCSVLATSPSEDSITNALITGDYGKCVFKVDNNVVDYQTVSLLFKNGIAATFTVSAFSEECDRTIKITGTKGELWGNMESGIVYYQPLAKPLQKIDVSGAFSDPAGHGGGDKGLMHDFCDLMQGKTSEYITSIAVSVESHVIALAAEYSRQHCGQIVSPQEFAEM